MQRDRIIGVAAAITAGLIAASPAARASDTMPVAQQNALVNKYCVVCHNDARLIGGMSLEHFDAAHPDPSIAGMMVSKLQYGAMGASGVQPPDAATLSAFIDALAASAAGAETTTGGWALRSNASPLPPPPPPTITASMEQRVSSTLYRLTIGCVKTPDMSTAAIASASHPAEMQLTANRAMSAAGAVPLIYEVDGVPQENSGGATFVMPLPHRTLAIRDLLPGETVTFRFDGLNPELRRMLSTCLASEPAR